MRRAPDSPTHPRRLLAGCLSAAVLAASSPAWAQQSADRTGLDEVQTEFAEAFEAIGEYSAAQRDEAVAATGETLDRIDAQIDTLERRIRDEWSEMSEASRERTAAALSDLRERRNALSEAFGALSQGTGSAWDDLVAGVRTGWNDLETAWDDAAEAFGDETGTGD